MAWFSIAQTGSGQFDKDVFERRAINLGYRAIRYCRRWSDFYHIVMIVWLMLLVLLRMASAAPSAASAC